MSSQHPDFEKTNDVGTYEPPAITELGSLMQNTAGTGRVRTRDAGGASV